jgi:tetratricopeptide (TPR) repeat protein
MSALWELIRSGIDRFTSKAVRIGFATILGGFLVVQPILNVYRFQQSIVLPDTRTVAKTWVEQRFRPTSAIATGPFGITLQDTNYNLLIIPFLAVNPERTAPFYDSRWYEDFDLLIASDYDYSRYARDPEKYGSFLPYYDSLRSRWKLLSEIKPEEHQLGPTLWFYTYPDSMRRNRFEPSLFEKLQGSIESTRVSSFLNKLGEVLLQKQKLEKSGQVMRQILSVEVDNVRIRNTLAQVLHSIGDDRGALLEVQRSLRTNPTQAELFGFAGDLLLSLGRSQEAELSYLKALQLNKYLNIAYTRLIAFYTERKDQTKLKNILERYYGVLPPRSDEAMRIRNELERLRGSS